MKVQQQRNYIAANWKMYKTPDQRREFFREFLPLVQPRSRRNCRVPKLVCDLLPSIGQRFKHPNRRRKIFIGKKKVLIPEKFPLACWSP